MKIEDNIIKRLINNVIKKSELFKLDLNIKTGKKLSNKVKLTFTKLI